MLEAVDDLSEILSCKKGARHKVERDHGGEQEDGGAIQSGGHVVLTLEALRR